MRSPTRKHLLSLILAMVALSLVVVSNTFRSEDLDDECYALQYIYSSEVSKDTFNSFSDFMNSNPKLVMTPAEYSVYYSKYGGADSAAILSSFDRVTFLRSYRSPEIRSMTVSREEFNRAPEMKERCMREG